MKSVLCSVWIITVVAALGWLATVDTARQLGPAAPPLLRRTAFLDFEEFPGATALASNVDMVHVARKRVQAEPLTPAAISMACRAGDATGTGSVLVPALRLAEAVSRRVPKVQLQLAAIAAQSGELSDMLVHVDRALLVDPSLQEKLLPPLIPALGDRRFRLAIKPFAARTWLWNFGRMAAAAPEGQVNAARLFWELGADEGRAPDELVPVVIRTFISSGDIRSAREFVLKNGKLQPSQLDAFSPTKANSKPDYVPVTWEVADNELALVKLEPEGQWEASIEAGRRAKLFMRITSFASGQYRAEVPVQSGSEPVLVSVRARCLPGSSGAGVEVLASLQSNETRRLILSPVFPRDCLAQEWVIEGSAPDAQTSASLVGAGEMTITRLQQ